MSTPNPPNLEENGNDVQLFARHRSKKIKRGDSDTQHRHVDETHRNHSHATQHVEQSKETIETANTFSELGLSEWLERVCADLGIVEPTPVQKGCIPAILQGRNVIGVAQTGTGKTAAFALPVIHALSKDPFGVFNLVLTPTRELAFQIADQYKAFGAGQTLRVSVVVGGLDSQDQAKQLEKRPHIVIATPGRLKALIDSDERLAKVFKRTAFLILDEADRLLDESFESDLDTILSLLPSKRQTLLFSATMTPTLVTLQKSLLKDAFVFEAYSGLKTATGLREEVMVIPAKVKEVYLSHVLRHIENFEVQSCIVFAGTRKSCQNLGILLAELDIPVAALHSGLAQKDRMAALERFKSGRVSILLATDVASRGLDIPEVDLVVNFDLPKLASDYVHRVGRTARAGRGGWSLSFVSQYDIDLLKTIESLTGVRMSKFELNEKDVLKGLSEVYTAKRCAHIKATKPKK